MSSIAFHTLNIRGALPLPSHLIHIGHPTQKTGRERDRETTFQGYLLSFHSARPFSPLSFLLSPGAAATAKIPLHTNTARSRGPE